MNRFCEEVRQSIIHEVREEAGEQVWVYRGDTLVAPIEWSIRIGEILYNLRSALDHLVWQLVLANEQKPSRHNAFPIVEEEKDWPKKKEQLKGVAPGVETMIERLQLFTGGIGLPFDVRAFQTLNTLCNIDKHRYLIVAIVNSSGIEPITFGYDHPPLHRSETSPPLRGSGLLGKIEKERILLRFNDARAEMKPSLRIKIGFQDIPEIGAGVVPAILRHCLEAVQGAVSILTRKA